MATLCCYGYFVKKRESMTGVNRRGHRAHPRPFVVRFPAGVNVGVHGDKRPDAVRDWRLGLSPIFEHLAGHRGGHTHVRQTQSVFLDGVLQFVQGRVPILLAMVQSLGAKFANTVCEASSSHKETLLSRRKSSDDTFLESVGSKGNLSKIPRLFVGERRLSGQVF